VENLKSNPRNNFPVQRKPVVGAEDEDDAAVMYDDKDDEDYEEGADITKRKKSYRGRGRGRGRGIRGRGRPPKGTTRSKQVPETPQDTSAPPQYDGKDLRTVVKDLKRAPVFPKIVHL